TPLRCVLGELGVRCSDLLPLPAESEFYQAQALLNETVGEGRVVKRLHHPVFANLKHVSNARHEMFFSCESRGVRISDRREGFESEFHRDSRMDVSPECFAVLGLLPIVVIWADTLCE